MHITNPSSSEVDTDRLLCPYATDFGGLGLTLWLHADTVPLVTTPMAHAAHLEVNTCGHPGHGQLVITGTPDQLRRFLTDALATLNNIR